jgi:hypothetical protein
MMKEEIQGDDLYGIDPEAEEFAWKNAQEPRTREQRKADALSKLTTWHPQCWAATASVDDSAHLVPLSFAWDDHHVIIASNVTFLTTRNLSRSGRIRLAFGDTRDVVLMDATLVETIPVEQADSAMADRYAEQSDWDPRWVGTGFAYFLLRPMRVQVWRQPSEFGERLIMKNGIWVV